MSQEKFPQEIYCIIPATTSRGAIFISNIQAASNPQTLFNHKIGAVITAISGRNLTQVIPRHIQYLYIPAIDHESFDISVFFKQSNLFIDQERLRTNVLVHCMAGISRSVTLVIAYLMKDMGWGVKKAFQIVKKARGQIFPNQGFIQQLAKYGDQLNTTKFHNQTNVRSVLINKNQNYSNLKIGQGKQKELDGRFKDEFHHEDYQRVSDKVEIQSYDGKLKQNIRKLFIQKSTTSTFSSYDNNRLQQIRKIR